jgi:hypothetical protein
MSLTPGRVRCTSRLRVIWGLGMRPAQARTGPSVLAFIRDPAVHGMTDVVAVPHCRAVPESGDPRTIRP